MRCHRPAQSLFSLQMSEGNNAIMLEARIEELQTKLNQATTAHTQLLKQFEAVLDLAQKYVPYEVMVEVLNDMITRECLI